MKVASDSKKREREHRGNPLGTGGPHTHTPRRGRTQKPKTENQKAASIMILDGRFGHFFNSISGPGGSEKKAELEAAVQWLASVRSNLPGQQLCFGRSRQVYSSLFAVNCMKPEICVPQCG